MHWSEKFKDIEILPEIWRTGESFEVIKIPRYVNCSFFKLSARDAKEIEERLEKVLESV